MINIRRVAIWLDCVCVCGIFSLVNKSLFFALELSEVHCYEFPWMKINISIKIACYQRKTESHLLIMRLIWRRSHFFTNTMRIHWIQSLIVEISKKSIQAIWENEVSTPIQTDFKNAFSWNDHGLCQRYKNNNKIRCVFQLNSIRILHILMELDEFSLFFPFFLAHKQHNFHEVADKGDYQEYMKRMLNDERIMPVKRNFDEIDRFGLNRFVQTSPYHSVWNKRNFDEIDRLVPQIFTDNKREDNNNDGRGGKYIKFI